MKNDCQFGHLKIHASMNLRLQTSKDTDNYSSLRSSEADLDYYREQLALERTARTLTLRRSQRPTLSAFLSKTPASSQAMLKSPLIDSANFPFLDPNYAIKQLSSNNLSTLAEFLNNITACAQQTPRLAYGLARNPDIPTAFINALNSEYPEQIKLMLMRALTVIFPISEDNKNVFIDDGLTFYLFDALSSQSLPLLEAAVMLTDSISESSSYARDSILSFGLLDFLVDIAKSERSESLTIQACEAMNKIFSNKTLIEATILASCVEPISKLLSLHSIPAVNIVLLCLLHMTNKSTALVFAIYEQKLFPVIVSMLNNPELTQNALPLIGNISVGNSEQISTLLECGLFPALMHLIDTQYTADVYWVLSNLVESTPHLTVPLFTSDFIEKSVDIATSAAFEVRRESAFFIATLIIFTSIQDLSFFLNDDTLDLICEMLALNNAILIVLRCLDAIIRISGYVINNALETVVPILNTLLSDGLRDKLEGLVESDSKVIEERASFILKQLDDLENSSLIAQ
ncbi:hypothetical protein M9Y10_004236 [Tritrichomonas musculus]|uniref:Uncharacterized protein n=1 Tax=Tritrichomonas musculus TaxID=1915356 RepID=A0ABR2JRU6_9EUKA